MSIIDFWRYKVIEDKQELELMDGFRQLCPADKNTILTAVTVAVGAEEAIKRHLKQSPACADYGKNSTDKSESVLEEQGA